MVPSRAKNIESPTAKKVSDDVKVANLIESIINGSNRSTLVRWNKLEMKWHRDTFTGWLNLELKEYLGRRLLSIEDICMHGAFIPWNRNRRHLLEENANGINSNSITSNIIQSLSNSNCIPKLYCLYLEMYSLEKNSKNNSILIHYYKEHFRRNFNRVLLPPII